MKEKILGKFEDQQNELLEELLEEIESTSNELVVALVYNTKKNKLYVSRFTETELYGMKNTIPVFVVKLPSELKDFISEWPKEEKISYLKWKVEEEIKNLEEV